MTKTFPGILFIVSAPSGAGKTSLVAALRAQDSSLAVSVSHTTRPRRAAEIDGVNYHFISSGTFTDMVESGDFLEHAQVFGNQYGTATSAVNKALATGQDLILEIDWQGAQQVRARFPDAISIFILPPSRQALIERLQHRGQDSQDIIKVRTAKAIEEISHYRDFDYLIVNDDFTVAVQEFAHVVSAARLRRQLQESRHQTLIDTLLQQP